MQVIRRSIIIFEENYVFIEEGNPQTKLIQLRKNKMELKDGIGNLMDFPRLLFIDEECGNLKVVVDGGEFTRNDNRKGKSEVLQAYRCPLCDKCY